MSISKEIRTILTDLVENKLSSMQVSDRDDAREVMILQRCLMELNGYDDCEGRLSASSMPRRGRRRKMLRV